MGWLIRDDGTEIVENEDVELITADELLGDSSSPPVLRLTVTNQRVTSKVGGQFLTPVQDGRGEPGRGCATRRRCR
jgi:hypothetical protein